MRTETQNGKAICVHSIKLFRRIACELKTKLGRYDDGKQYI